MGRKTRGDAEIIAYKRDRFFFADPWRNRGIQLGKPRTFPNRTGTAGCCERNQKKYKKSPVKGGKKHRFPLIFV
jgi:hypothetical protein